MNMNDPGRSPDEAPTQVASSEMEAEYFRRLRLYNFSVAARVALVIGGSFCVVLISNVLIRVVGSGLCALLWVVMLCLQTKFFRCPACDYIFATGPWQSEPKWHQCPSCRMQFTKERKLRWPNF